MTTMLTQKQLAERWSLSARTLEAWRWQGIGPHFIKIGRRVLYRLQDIEAFENAGLRPPPSSRCDGLT